MSDPADKRTAKRSCDDVSGEAEFPVEARRQTATDDTDAVLSRLKAVEARIEAETKEREAQLKAEAKEREAQIASLKAGSSRKGVTTQAQFYQQLQKELEYSPRAGDTWDTEEEWPSGISLSAPRDKCPESDQKDGTTGVQSHFSKLLQELKDKLGASAFSLPDPQAYRKASFKTRKPDVVNYEKEKTGSLSITSFGDLKGRASGDFSDEEKGHVLDMARSYMTDVAFHRPFIIVFLSDGKRWQFFRVMRKDLTSLAYVEGPVIDDHALGWKRYVALLKAKLHDLGHVTPEIPGVQLLQALGRGGAASVFQGVFQGSKGTTTGVVKVYTEKKGSSLAAEQSALKKLDGVANVPQLVDVFYLNNTVPGTLGQALLATPDGSPVLPVPNGKALSGVHLKQLVTALQKGHQIGLAHRDVKPENIYLHGNDIILNDWGSSVEIDQENEVWEGTIGFSVHFKEKDYGELSVKARDLVSLVRCAYSVLFQERPPSSDAVEAEEFWKKSFRTGTYWADAIRLAKKEDYDELGTLLERMK